MSLRGLREEISAYYVLSTLRTYYKIDHMAVGSLRDDIWLSEPLHLMVSNHNRSTYLISSHAIVPHSRQLQPLCTAAYIPLLFVPWYGQPFLVIWLLLCYLRVWIEQTKSTMEATALQFSGTNQSKNFYNEGICTSMQGGSWRKLVQHCKAVVTRERSSTNPSVEPSSFCVLWTRSPWASTGTWSMSTGGKCFQIEEGTYRWVEWIRCSQSLLTISSFPLAEQCRPQLWKRHCGKSEPACE